MNEDEGTSYNPVGVPYDLYLMALRFTLIKGEMSSPMLQREFSIPYHISARLMDLLELNKVIAEDNEPGQRRKVMFHLD